MGVVTHALLTPILEDIVMSMSFDKNTTNYFYLKAQRDMTHEQKIGVIAIRKNGDGTFDVAGSVLSPLDRFVARTGIVKALSRLDSNSKPGRAIRPTALVHKATYTEDDIKKLEIMDLLEDLGLDNNWIHESGVDINAYGNQKKFTNVIKWFTSKKENANTQAQETAHAAI